MTLTAKRMAAIDEAPSYREGGPIFAFREVGAEYRSGGQGRECRTCGAVVADAAHWTVCERRRPSRPPIGLRVVQG